jgi:serine/threonine protein kinase
MSNTSVSYQVIHRDLKLANVLLVRELPGDPLEAKLCDFGLHRLAPPLPKARRNADASGRDGVHDVEGINDIDDA